MEACNLNVTENTLDEPQRVGLFLRWQMPAIFKTRQIHKIVSKRIFTTFAAFVFLAAGLRAEFNMDALIARASGDPANAPAMIANAVVANPKLVSQIVSAALTAMPKQAVQIVRALLKVDPEQANQIVQAAIRAQPNLAVQITDAAVETLPNQAADIVKAAIAAAPADLSDAIAASVTGNGGSNGGHGGGGFGSGLGQFPQQPINPDLVSPSR
jgi:hypothetical protein